ncbi:MAG: hypothetical protein FWB83_03130 [Treponema sp.]|nr:hypothetical protein [Treponema sp.]
MDKEDLVPMDIPHKIPINLRFTFDQYKKILGGLNPQMMEDKWFIITEDDVIHCHRSWTGYETWRAELIKSGDSGHDGYVIKEILAERNAAKYTNTDDERDKMQFTKIIAWFILEVKEEDIRSD